MRGRPRRLVTLAILGTVVAYVVAAGASPSVVRAAVMAGVVLLARESGRAGRAPTALALAAALLLIAEPTMIGDAGFRLSVMATAGLLAWANPLATRLRRVAGGRLPGWLAESLGISLAAQAATLPDVLATFGRLSLVSPVVNLAVVPLVPAAMLGGVVAMLAGGASMLGAPAAVATLAGLPGWVVLHVIVTDRPHRRGRAVRGADAACGRRPAGGARHRRRDPARTGGVDASPAGPGRSHRSRWRTTCPRGSTAPSDSPVGQAHRTP